MLDEKKKFKDTKVGKFLTQKAPKILDSVGDILPSNGVFGIVKNLISSSDEMSAEDKVTALQELDNSIQAFELEVKDRDSARLREVEMAKVGKFDFLFYLTGLVGLFVFCFIVYAIVFLQIPEQNKEIWIHLIGISEGVVLSIFGYYFGSAVKKNVHP
jgi:hypothetical protein